MLRRTMLKGVAAIAAAGVFTRHAGAQEVLKMGISIPMTGAGFNAVGRQLAAAIKLYVQQHGDIVAGRKIEIIVRDDGGVADTARRIVKEMIVNEKVGLLGIGITPTSLASLPMSEATTKRPSRWCGPRPIWTPRWTSTRPPHRRCCRRVSYWPICCSNSTSRRPPWSSTEQC